MIISSEDQKELIAKIASNAIKEYTGSEPEESRVYQLLEIYESVVNNSILSETEKHGTILSMIIGVEN